MSEHSDTPPPDAAVDSNVIDLDARRARDEEFRDEDLRMSEGRPGLALVVRDREAHGLVRAAPAWAHGWTMAPDELEDFAIELIHLAEIVRAEQRALDREGGQPA